MPGRRRSPGTRRRPRVRRAPRPSCRAPARRPGTRGEPRARSGPRPTETAPARRRGPLPSAAIGSPWSARERRIASAAWRRSASSRSSASAARGVTSTSCRAMNASSWSAIHGSSGTRRCRRRPADARRRARRPDPRAPRAGAARRPRPGTRRASPVAVRRRARRAGGSARRRCPGAPRAARAAHCAALAVSGTSSLPSRSTAPPERLGDGTGERVEHPPAAPVVARRAHVADPAARDPGEPFDDLLIGGQLGIAFERVGDLDSGPVLGRRRPLPGVPVEAAVRDRAHVLDEPRSNGNASTTIRCPAPSWRSSIFGRSGASSISRPKLATWRDAAGPRPAERHRLIATYFVARYSSIPS